MNILTICLTLLSIFSVNSDQYTDENRPYEFGFNIEGEQHRHEKKDENGIINGEFGFITADGVYHVTVYATDENGNFRILSMKNIRLKPFPTTRSSAAHGKSLKHGSKATTVLTQTVVTSTRKTITQPPNQPVQSCSHCKIPIVTSEAPADVVINNVPIYDGLSNQGETQTDLAIPQNDNKGNNPLQKSNSFTNIPNSFDNFGNGPAYNNIGNGTNDNYPGSSGTSEVNKENNGIINYHSNNNNVSPGNKPNNKNPSQTNIDHPDRTDTGFAHEYNSNFNHVADSENQSNNYPNSYKYNTNIILATKTQREGKSNTRFSDFEQETVRQSQKPEFKNLDEKKPVLITAQMSIVENTPDINNKKPGEQDGLPTGLETKDISNLLYTFNYTLGFHGHHEEGYSNGAKKGYYFITGRDGIKTRVDYEADENGFRPKISKEVLDILSDDVPKPETEKDENIAGLKGYEFRWLYFPVSK